jgi:hypothetical protein
VQPVRNPGQPSSRLDLHRRRIRTRYRRLKYQDARKAAHTFAPLRTGPRYPR